MSSIVIAGDTSGSVTLQAPAVSGSTVLNLPATSGTIQASGAGYTTNGVAYASSTSALTTGSALTFDGTNMAVGTTPTSFGAGYSVLTVQGSTTGFVQASNGTIVTEVGTFGGIGYTGTRSNHSYGFVVNGSEQMRLTSTGLGIGTSSPSAPLTVQGNSGGNGINIIGRSTGQNESWLQWYQNNGSTLNSGILGDNQGLKFAVGSGQTERARIDTSGNLLVGTTSTFGKLTTYSTATGTPTAGFFANTTSFTSNVLGISCARTTTNGTYNLIYAYTDNLNGQFIVRDSGNCLNTNNSYGALSDVKLKENIVDASPKLADLMQIKVRNYNLKNEPDHKQLGVIAQELETVFPAMVEESPDRDKQGNDLGTTTKSVKYSVFVPMLIKAIQEQQALITQLTERITALEAK